MKHNKLEEGSQEIYAVFLLFFIQLVILTLMIVSVLFTFNFYIDDLMNDISRSVIREVETFRINDDDEIQAVFERVKTKFNNDYEKFYSRTLLPSKIRQTFLDSMELRMVTEEGEKFQVGNSDNIKYGKRMYVIDLNMERDLVYKVVLVPYSPVKETFLFINEYDTR